MVTGRAGGSRGSGDMLSSLLTMIRNNRFFREDRRKPGSGSGFGSCLGRHQRDNKE
ncbi:hypothetical protein [Methanocalculus natronophilus]|uniref:hypothetical protein n=1 Tax=Methanocalculus natronophilus TaxID=1262400 RepID=UPI0031B59B58